MKVLLAVDEVGALLRIASLLRGAGYQIEICNDGNRFCEMAESCLPDIGMLSSTTSLWDAFEIAATFKRRAALHDIPLLLVAASWHEVEERSLACHESLAARQTGAYPADDYLVHPYGDQELLFRVQALERVVAQRRMLQRRESELAALKEVSTASSDLLGAQAVLKAALNTVLDVLDMEAGGVYLLPDPPERDGVALELRLYQGISASFANLVRHLPQSTLFSPDCHEARIADVADYHHTFLKAALVNEDYVVVGQVPLVAHDQMRGLITFASRRPHTVSEQDLQVLTAIGRQVGLALQANELYQTLQKERDFANRMLDTMAEGLLLEDEQGYITFANPALAQFLGLEPDALVGRHALSIFREQDVAQVRREHARRQVGLSGCYEVNLISENGTELPVLVNATPIIERGAYRGTLTVLTDIMALRQAQQASQDSEERYRVLAEESPLGIMIMRGEQVLYANRRVERSWSAPGDLASLLSRVQEADRPRVVHWLDDQSVGGQPEPIEIQMRDAQSEQMRWYVFRGASVRYGAEVARLITVADVTEQRLADQALLHTERLRALGQMAGGVAHNFNNILAGIQGYLDLANEDVENPEALRGHLKRIATGTQDAAQAVRRLQSLYRVFDDKSDLVSVNLPEIVQDAVALTRPRWWDEPQRQGVQVQLRSDVDALPAVMGNPGELREVLTNLIFNAVEAMPAGGLISIIGEVDGDEVLLQVRDTGVGMSPEQLARVGEPFYTTKGATGSGLGLSISQRIIARHGGTLDVESAVGLGTTFTLRLPATDVPVSAQPSTRPSTVQQGFHILVVDDEPTIADMLRRMLVRQGQAVKLAHNGQEALRALESDQFQLVITDLGMPDLSGSVVAQRAHELHPDLPVILATGWGDTMTPEQLAEMGVQDLLPKPFTYSQVRQVLASHLPRSDQE